MRTRVVAIPALALTIAALGVAGCGDDDDSSTSSAEKTTSTAAKNVDGVVKIEGGRGLYAKCTGTGSPTVVMEGGDDDTSESYAFAEPKVSKLTPDVRL